MSSVETLNSKKELLTCRLRKTDEMITSVGKPYEKIKDIKLFKTFKSLILTVQVITVLIKLWQILRPDFAVVVFYNVGKTENLHLLHLKGLFICFWQCLVRYYTF